MFKKLVFILSFIIVFQIIILAQNNGGKTMIKMTFGGNEIYGEVLNTQSGKEFLSQLPANLKFEDYNSTEKISYLPTKLSGQGEPEGFTPKRGDISYYMPWGNLAIFYRDFRYSRSLIKIGTLNDIDKLANMRGSFEVRIEVVD
ncbi:cyclophilin-like fold protein [Brachyspira sp.]|uniref:cyclophilin-like fold protein n=1 Tax=Brachyspira sp. TaxID=1977261 RepID=UPI003D7C7759